MTPDLRIFEDKIWWLPYHLPPTEGNVIHSGGAVLNASDAPLVLVFDDEQDARDYLAEMEGRCGPDAFRIGQVPHFEITWEGFDCYPLQKGKLRDVLLEHGYVPIVVHHAWAGSLLKKLRNNGVAACTNLAVQRHAQLARRLHEG